MKELLIIGSIAFCALILYFVMNRLMNTVHKPLIVQPQRKMKIVTDNPIYLQLLDGAIDTDRCSISTGRSTDIKSSILRNSVDLAILSDEDECESSDLNYLSGECYLSAVKIGENIPVDPISHRKTTIQIFYSNNIAGLIRQLIQRGILCEVHYRA